MAKILLVDDSAFQRKILKDMVEDIGHEVVEATNGEEAISIIDQEHINLVCLDLLMPGISGIDVLEHFQQIEDAPPIIIISADIQVAKKEQCMALGASSFINKYIEKEELEKNLNQYLK